MASEKDPPSRVVILVIDQLRPDYIDTYHLKYLKQLRDQSISYPNASTGHFPSITLMSHPVISTGAFPKHFGWSGEAYRDDEGILGKVSLWYDISELSYEQLEKILIRNLPTPTPLSLIKKKLGGKIYAVGQKEYAALTFGGIDADSIITLKKIKEGNYKGWCKPAGYRVPNSLTSPEGNRFYVDCKNNFGTENEITKLDGRYVPGNNSKHLGGDIWSTDVALHLMKQDPSWRVMLLTLAGVDKVGHVFGEMDGSFETTQSPYSLKKVLKIADGQVGRLIAHLKQRKLWDKTIFVLTSDHGAISTRKHFYGDIAAGASGRNSLYGTYATGDVLEPSEILKPWIQKGAIHHGVFDTALRLWTKKDCSLFANMPGARAVYQKKN